MPLFFMPNVSRMLIIAIMPIFRFDFAYFRLILLGDKGKRTLALAIGAENENVQELRDGRIRTGRSAL